MDDDDVAVEIERGACVGEHAGWDGHGDGATGEAGGGSLRASPTGGVLDAYGLELGRKEAAEAVLVGSVADGRLLPALPPLLLLACAFARLSGVL